MAFTAIARAAAGSGDNNNVTSGAIDTTGADLLIAIVSDFGAGSVSTVTDSKGNTWHGLTTRQNGTAARCRIWWSTPTSVGGSHTATASSTGQFPSIDFRAYSGSHQTSPFDVENGTTVTATTIGPLGFTPTYDNSLIVAGAAADSGTGFTIDSSFTRLDNVASGASKEALGGADLIQGTKATVSPTWTNSGSTNLAMVEAIFRPPDVSGGSMLDFF